jgi:hypothetical protein
VPITLEPDSFSPLPSVLVPPHHLSNPACWLDGPMSTDQHHHRSSCHETDVYPWIFFHTSYALLCSRAPYVVFIVKHRGRVSSYNIQMTTPIHFRSHPHRSRSSSLSQQRYPIVRWMAITPSSIPGQEADSYIWIYFLHRTPPFCTTAVSLIISIVFIIQHRPGSPYHPSVRCVCFNSQSSSSSLL